MKQFILRWLIQCLALVVVLHIVSGVSAANLETVLIAALVLGLLNVFVRPILLVLTLPLNILSLGLFTLIINAFLFSVAARFVKGFSVNGFWSAFWAALLFSVISFLLNQLFLGPEERVHVHRFSSSPPEQPERRNVIDVEKGSDTTVESDDRPDPTLHPPL